MEKISDVTMGELARHAYAAFAKENNSVVFDQLPETEKQQWLKVVAVIGAIFAPYVSTDAVNAEAEFEAIKRQLR